MSKSGAGQFLNADRELGRKILNRFISRLPGALFCALTVFGATAGPALAAGKNIVLAQSTISEKEAFDGAKELGTIEAWEAFLNNFPKGFRADLARAYLKKIGQQSSAPVAPAPVPSATPPAPLAPAPQPVVRPAPPPPPPVLQPVHLGPGTSPWRNGNYAMDEGNASAYSASVQSSGLELTAYCSANRQLNVVLGESQRGLYPGFDQRISQGLTASLGQYGTPDTRISIRFSNNSEHIVPANVMGLTGEVSIRSTAPGGEFRPGGRFINDMMSSRSMTLSAPPFGATFQLKGSRRTICNVLTSCGVSTPGCAKFAPAPVSTYTPPPKKKTYTKRKKAGCPGGTVRLEGQCIKKSQVTSFCGPGYKRSGSKCVSRYPATAAQPPAQQKKKTGCPGGTVRLEGQCIKKSQVTSFCGPGYKRSGSKCVSRYPATAAQPPTQQQQQPNLAPAIQLLQGIAGAIQQQKKKKKSASPQQAVPGPTTAPPPQTATIPNAPNAPPEPPTQQRVIKKTKCPGGLVPGKKGGCVVPTCGPGQQATLNGCVTISDVRLKRNIAHVATLENGIRLYAFRYLWEESAYVGVMAQDLLADVRARDAVVLRPSGYYTVDYAALGLRMATAGEWHARGLASVRLRTAQGQLGAMPVGLAQ